MRRDKASTERMWGEGALLTTVRLWQCRLATYPPGEHAQHRTRTRTHPDGTDVWASGGMFGR
eukprot:952902-Prymnesium_polylepis.1